MDFDALADEEPADAAGKAKDYDGRGPAVMIIASQCHACPRVYVCDVMYT